MRTSTWSSWTLLSIIGSAYVLRILMMPITGQHDVLFMPWMTQYLSIDSPNIYANLHIKFGDDVLKHPAVWAPYPYGFYALTALWSQVVEVIGRYDFQTWETTWQLENPARLVFYFKLIYLPFDFLILYLLFSKISKLSALLWAWSPVAIYTPFMMGQNDIYATACSVVAIWTFSRYRSESVASQSFPTQSVNKPDERWLWIAMFLLGLGASFKIFPLLLLPPLLLSIDISWIARIRLGVIGVTTFLLSVVPFLTTDAYLQGVLFNPEGSQLFRRISIFGIDVPVFILSYAVLLLCILLLHQKNRDGNDHSRKQPLPASPWMLSTLVLALLFLLVPAPSYWLIWITPFLAVIAAQSKLFLAAWVIVQSSFALTLPSLHSELGIALPIHLVDGINIPNLSTVLHVEFPGLGNLYQPFLVSVNGIFIGGLVLAICAIVYQTWNKAEDNYPTNGGNDGWLVNKFYATGDRSNNHGRPRWLVLSVILLPTILLFVGLGLNLYMGRQLVHQNRWQNWQLYELSAASPMSQEIVDDQGTLHGAWVKVIDAPTDVMLSLCIYESDITQQETPMACTSANTNTRISDGRLFFKLDEPIRIKKETYSLKIQSEGANSSVLVEAAENAHFGSIQLGNRITKGHANLSLLKEFEPQTVIQQLFVVNIFQDAQLLIGMISVLIIVLGLVFLGLEQFSVVSY